MSDVWVRCAQVGKRFLQYRRPVDRLWEALFGGRRHTVQWAVRGVNLSVAAGEAVAVVGRNGAGKSTLLKVVMGVLVPDEGAVTRRGGVTGLLELGAGFDPRLSGRENLRLNGLLLGMSEAAVRRQEEAIIAFAELAHAIDLPLRSYSSGMVMRLGFAVAAHAGARCLVVDEALAVGDAAFQQKCWDFLRRFRREGGSLLLVSHDLNAVRQVADRAVLLEQGQVAAEGDVEMVVTEYLRLIGGEEARSVSEGGFGSGEVRFVAAPTLVVQGVAVTQVACGQEVALVARVRAHAAVEGVSFGFAVRDRFGVEVFGMNSWQWGRTFAFAAGEERTVRVRWRCELAPGAYTITVALHPGAHHVGQCFHWWERALAFEVAGVLGPPFAGVARLPVIAFGLAGEGEHDGA